MRPRLRSKGWLAGTAASMLAAVMMTPVSGSISIEREASKVAFAENESERPGETYPKPADSVGVTALSDLPLPYEARKQLPLIDAAADLEVFARSLPESGFGSLQVDFDDSQIELYWKGDLPSDLADWIQEMPYPVSTSPATATWEDLAAEARRLLDQIRRDDLLAESIQFVQISSDASGLIVHVPDTGDRGVDVLATVAQRLDTEVDLQVRLSDWEVDVEPFVPGWRWDDEKPFIGGAVMEKSSGGWCTSGFVARSLLDTTRSMLTAKHCGVNEQWSTPVSGRVFGTTNHTFQDIDIAAIHWNKSSPGYPGFFAGAYAGVYNGTAWVHVTESGWAIKDQFVCTSGGFSGINCEQRVTDTGVFSQTYGGPLFRTDHEHGVAWTGQGDSGGPVFGASASGQGVRALGIISFGIPPFGQCQGWDPWWMGRICGPVSFHGEVQYALNHMNWVIAHPFDGT